MGWNGRVILTSPHRKRRAWSIERPRHLATRRESLILRRRVFAEVVPIDQDDPTYQNEYLAALRRRSSNHMARQLARLLNGILRWPRDASFGCLGAVRRSVCPSAQSVITTRSGSSTATAQAQRQRVAPGAAAWTGGVQAYLRAVPQGLASRGCSPPAHLSRCCCPTWTRLRPANERAHCYPPRSYKERWRGEHYAFHPPSSY